MYFSSHVLATILREYLESKKDKKRFTKYHTYPRIPNGKVTESLPRNLDVQLYVDFCLKNDIRVKQYHVGEYTSTY